MLLSLKISSFLGAVTKLTVTDATILEMTNCFRYFQIMMLTIMTMMMLTMISMMVMISMMMMMKQCSRRGSGRAEVPAVFHQPASPLRLADCRNHRHHHHHFGNFCEDHMIIMIIICHMIIIITKIAVLICVSMELSRNRMETALMANVISYVL